MKYLLLILTAVLTSQASLAQTPSAAQIEQFKQLPKAQQDALAKQYGLDLSSIRGQTFPNKAVTNPQVVIPIDINSQTSKEEQVAKSAATEQLSDVKEFRNAKPKLSLFGYDLFAGAPTTFAPASDIPIPSEYVIGPGDNIKLNIYGKENMQLDLIVDREGQINVPPLGPLYVAGLSFKELKEVMAQEAEQRAIGMNVIATLGELRSIRIFILGEANRPGSYTVSALSTITNALFVSGGIKKTGTLRNIQLKRNGRVVTSFDLYDLLLRGDTSRDDRLLPGDVLFIPPIGDTAGVGGEVKRSAIFELKDEETFDQLIALSGGFLPTSYLPATKVNRIDDKGKRIVIDLDLTNKTNTKQPLKTGDLVTVYSILDSIETVVSMEGHLYRPGNYAHTPGMQVSDLFDGIQDFLPGVDLQYALIRREVKETREIYFEVFSLRDVIFTEQVIPLLPRDKLYFFALAGERDGLIAEDVKRLYRQTALNTPAEVIIITGAVKQPGTYPFIPEMTVKSLLNAAGNLTLNADEDYAVIVSTDKKRDIYVSQLDLSSDDGLERKLKTEDTLYVFAKDQDRADGLEPIIQRLRQQVSKDVDDFIVRITGSVRFPGEYPYVEGMSVDQLVAAAGGYREDAYLIEANVSRFNTDYKETANRKPLTVSLLEKSEFKLQAKDFVRIKKIPDWTEDKFVTLGGEYVFPGQYLINEGETLEQLIKRAGGFSNDAFLGGAVFLRNSVATQQKEVLNRLDVLIERQLTIASSAKAMSALPNSGPTQIADFSKLSQLTDAIAEKGLGRVSIDLSAAVAGLGEPIELMDGDSLYVPRNMSTVSVVGEVQVSSSHIHDSDLSLGDYLELAGGTTQFAEESRIYVVRANGQVYQPSRNWFRFTDTELKAGDTVVVPLDVSLTDNLTLWQQVTQIIYNSAISIAAIRGL